MEGPIRSTSETGAQLQGPELRVLRGGPQQQERAPPRLQPGEQEGARAHPQRRADLRVARHLGVHRRGLQRSRPVPPPRRPPRSRRRSLLGRLHRPQASCPMVEDVHGQDGGGEGRRDEADARGGGGAGGRTEGVLQGEALLRWRQRRLRRRRAGRYGLVDARNRGALWRRALRRRQDPASAGVDGALRRAARRRGGSAGRWQVGRVCQGEAGTEDSSLGRHDRWCDSYSVGYICACAIGLYNQTR